MRYQKDKRDTNEKDLCELILELGGSYTKMHANGGFDLVVVLNGVHIVEVKNPEYKWKLTADELKKKEEVERSGGVYNIVQRDEDILRLSDN